VARTSSTSSDQKTDKQESDFPIYHIFVFLVHGWREKRTGFSKSGQLYMQIRNPYLAVSQLMSQGSPMGIISDESDS
jgi:hypothetical protein